MKTKMSDKHTLTYAQDPLTDLKAVMGTMKSFKDAKVPSNPFKEGTPKTQIDAFYAPHKGKVPR